MRGTSGHAYETEVVLACLRESVGAGCMRIYACGAPFSGANCPSGSMEFLKDDGLLLKQPSGLEALLLNWEASRWLMAQAEDGVGFCDE